MRAWLLLLATGLVALGLALLAWAALTGPSRTAVVAALAAAAAVVARSVLRLARREPSYFGPPAWGWRGRVFTWLAVSVVYLAGDTVRFALGEDGAALRDALVVWALAGSAAWWVGRRLDPWLRGGAVAGTAASPRPMSASPAPATVPAQVRRVLRDRRQVP